MRILQLTVDSPWPPKSGGEIRCAFIARSAAELLGPTHIVCLGPLNAGAMPANMTASGTPGFDDSNPWHHHDPIIRTMLRLPAEAAAHIAAEIERFRPDAAIVEGVIVADAIALFQAAGVPVVLDMHNIESDLFRAIRRAKSPLRRLGDALRGNRRWRGLRDFDTMASRAADETWVTSQNDRRRLAEFGGAEAVVIPNPVPNAAIFEIPLDAARYAAPHAVYVAHLSYPPNITAARELATSIWPAAARNVPQARLTIAGRDPTAAVTALARPDSIRILADPEDTGALLAGHGYTLMPIREGGGTRIKVLEAMAAGLAVIATAKAVEGLPIKDGVHYLRAERANEFAGALRRLRGDPAAAAAMAGRARTFVRENYDAGALARMIAARLEGLKRA